MASQPLAFYRWGNCTVRRFEAIAGKAKRRCSIHAKSSAQLAVQPTDDVVEEVAVLSQGIVAELTLGSSSAAVGNRNVKPELPAHWAH